MIISFNSGAKNVILNREKRSTPPSYTIENKSKKFHSPSFTFSRATNELFQVALRRQQAQEESEARELGLQLQYNTGSCTTAPVLPAAAGTTPAGSPPPHPAHVASPAGLGIPAAAAAAAAAAAVHIQSQLQHQPAECGLLPRKRSTQDEYRQPKVEKGDPVVGKRIARLLPDLNRKGLSSLLYYYFLIAPSKFSM